MINRYIEEEKKKSNTAQKGETRKMKAGRKMKIKQEERAPVFPRDCRSKLAVYSIDSPLGLGLNFKKSAKSGICGIKYRKSLPNLETAAVHANAISLFFCGLSFLKCPSWKGNGR